MSTQKRIAAAALRVAGVALAAGVFSAATLGAAPPVLAIAASVPLMYQLSVPVVVVPPVLASMHRTLAAPLGGGDPVAQVAAASDARDGMLGLCALALLVAWSTTFASKASRTRGQPFSIA